MIKSLLISTLVSLITLIQDLPYTDSTGILSLLLCQVFYNNCDIQVRLIFCNFKFVDFKNPKSYDKPIKPVAAF